MLHVGCTAPLGCNLGSWVLRSQVGFSGHGSGSRVKVSGRQLQLVHCAYLLSRSRDFVHISGSRILRYSGWVVQGWDGRMREYKAELRQSSRGGSSREYKTRQSRYSDCRNIHDTGNFYSLNGTYRMQRIQRNKDRSMGGTQNMEQA